MLVKENTIRELIKSILLEYKMQDLVRSTDWDASGEQSDSEGMISTIQPDDSAVIKGNKFIVHGVEFQSEPAEGAGNVAEQLYNSAMKAGQKGKNWESTPTGRAWVSSNIYDASKSGSGVTYGPRLGTKNESFWSSWFFSVCYKGFSADEGHGRGSSHFDYGADLSLIQI